MSIDPIIFLYNQKLKMVKRISELKIFSNRFIQYKNYIQFYISGQKNKNVRLEGVNKTYS